MAYAFNKTTGEITISGFEKGVAVSPHKGIANIQAGNISTETGEVMCSFNRISQNLPIGSATMNLSYDTSSSLASSASIAGGIWITVTGSNHTGELPNATYYVRVSQNSKIELATTYTGASITGFTAGITASFIYNRTMSVPISSAVETYYDGSTSQTRYYILDAGGLLWVKDTAITTPGVGWMLPDRSVISDASSITVLNGWILLFSKNYINTKSTSVLWKNVITGNPGWSGFQYGPLMSPTASSGNHFSFTGHQGRTYYTDGNYIGSIFPSTSLLTGATNVQSYGSFTASGTAGTISAQINGVTPIVPNTSIRVPAFFFSSNTNPTALVVGTKYYMVVSPTDPNSFTVYAAASGGSPLDLQTGSLGTQYYNTFFPCSADGSLTYTFTPQRLNLPFYETAQSMVEVGNYIIIGCKGNVLYPWNQIDALPSDIIPLPENNVVKMITVNNMAYVFAGAKGNIYVTNGSTASIALSVPDYCAGVPGTPATYIEPYFIWGDAIYMRGRIWFSIQDQMAAVTGFPAKAGNCGGIWSFVPSQNFYIGQDTGQSLRLENQSSYGTYNGASSVLIASQTQTGNGPQYWSGWYSSVSTPTYGIDFSGVTTSTPCVVESDLIPTGTMLDKKTFEQIEYKLSAPLASGESVALAYRQNGTDAWVSCGTAKTEPTNALSGYYDISFEKGQWLQIQATLTPNGATNASTFVRLNQIIIR